MVMVMIMVIVMVMVMIMVMVMVMVTVTVTVTVMVYRAARAKSRYTGVVWLAKGWLAKGEPQICLCFVSFSSSASYHNLLTPILHGMMQMIS